MNVIIYKPSRNSMQSGFSKTSLWILKCESDNSCGVESLMGWTSSNNTTNQVKLKFKSQNEAIIFAEKKGWNYSTRLEQTRDIKPKNYSDTFFK